MARNGDIYLGSTEETVELVSPFGRKLKIEGMELSRSQRTASGKLRKDIYADKKKITLDYQMIDGDQLEAFIGLYETYDELIIQIYHTDDDPTTTEDPEVNYDQYAVIMEPISRERLTLRGDGLWTGVSIVFNEV